MIKQMQNDLRIDEQLWMKNPPFVSICLFSLILRGPRYDAGLSVKWNLYKLDVWFLQVTSSFNLAWEFAICSEFSSCTQYSSPVSDEKPISIIETITRISFFQSCIRIQEHEFRSISPMLRDENKNFFLSISGFFEKKTRIFFCKSHVLRQKQETENYISMLCKKKSSWFSREFLRTRIPRILWSAL